jgi:adenylate cyclase
MTQTETLTTAKPFQVGDWLADPDSDRLLCGEEEVRLEPKVMSVLVCLAQHAGKVVSRETLENTVWAGTIVGYDAIAGSVIKLRKALGDDSRNPLYIETVSKKGYRLIAPVSWDVQRDLDTEGGAEAEEVDDAEARLPSSLRGRNRSVSRQLISAIIGLVIIFAGYQILDMKQQPPTQPTSEQGEATTATTISTSDKTPSIVVLPFKNLSDDPQQDYFSDGITDDVTTDLSKVGALRVVARQSAYHYKNTSASLEDIARDLNVRYIVEGSVQKANEKIRINVQLTDASSGHHLWAERFDRDLVDVFAIQDEIAQHIIDATFVTLSEQETARVKFHTTTNFEAYDLFLRGQEYSKNRTREDYDSTMDAYRRALELDPNYARVYGAMAVELTRGYRNLWTNLSFEEAREHSLKLAKKAVALDQSTPQIYWALGFVHLFRKEFAEAEAATQQSITLSPNYADGYGLLAFIANWRGKAEEAERYITKAIGLNPYHTFDYPWNLGLSYYIAGRYSEAIDPLLDALNRNETATYPRMFLAASYVRLGQMDDAEWEMGQVIMQRPDTTASHLALTLPFEHQAQLNAVLDDLKKAGLPD